MKPAILNEFQGFSMKYEVELPTDVDLRLHARASETGDDVPTVIRLAILYFVDHELKNVPSRRRLPDPPLEPCEISAPFDLPRSPGRLMTPISISPESKRWPDPPELFFDSP